MAVDSPNHISDIAGQPAGAHLPKATAGSTSRSVLLGRAAECATIERLLEAAGRGESGSLVLRGEAGMGKTALLGHALDQASGMTVLRTTGVEVESDLAFAGLHALLRPIADQLGQLPEPQRAALAAALGLATGGGADRFLVSAGVLSLLAAAAESRPVLCAVDDAQWLDAPSADSLVFAARRLVAEGVVIVFGARDGELARFDAAGLDEHVLPGLDDRSAATLLERGVRRLESSVRERLLADAGGNPLALLELPSALSEAQLAGREPLPEALPLSARLRTVFMERIERLARPARAALLVAGAADANELGAIRRAISELELPQDALEPAEAIGLVRTDGVTLTFRHPLVRAAVYESATPGQRQQVHAALARALQGRPDGDRALWHEAMAATAPDEAIADALERSAHQGQQRGGHASAATAFERAARLTDAESARGRRLALAAQAAWMAGQANRARGLINRSLPLADRPQRARLLFLAGTIEGHNGWLDDGVRTLEKAAALPIALQMQAAGLIGQSRFDLAYSTAEEGLRLANDVGQPWAASWNLAHLAMIDSRREPNNSPDCTSISCRRSLPPAEPTPSPSTHGGRWACSTSVSAGPRRRLSSYRWCSRPSAPNPSAVRARVTRCGRGRRPRQPPTRGSRASRSVSRVGADVSQPRTPGAARSLPRDRARSGRRAPFRAGDRIRARAFTCWATRWFGMWMTCVVGMRGDGRHNDQRVAGGRGRGVAARRGLPSRAPLRGSLRSALSGRP